MLKKVKENKSLNTHTHSTHTLYLCFVVDTLHDASKCLRKRNLFSAFFDTFFQHNLFLYRDVIQDLKYVPESRVVKVKEFNGIKIIK